MLSYFRDLLEYVDIILLIKFTYRVIPLYILNYSFCCPLLQGYLVSRGARWGPYGSVFGVLSSLTCVSYLRMRHDARPLSMNVTPLLCRKISYPRMRHNVLPLVTNVTPLLQEKMYRILFNLGLKLKFGLEFIPWLWLRLNLSQAFLIWCPCLLFIYNYTMHHSTNLNLPVSSFVTLFQRAEIIRVYQIH